MPRHTEPTANSLLGGMLAGMLQTYDVLSENTQQIVGRPGLQPDILVTAPGRAPVVIEAEFMPAYTAEEEARDRLALEVVGTARYIDAAIALRYPDWHRRTQTTSPLHCRRRPALLLRVVPGRVRDSLSPAGWRARSKTWQTSSDWYPCRSARWTRPPTRSKKA